MTIDQILAKYRAVATSESDKGASFEKLMVNFLKTYQVYDHRFARVWLWRDFPFHGQISERDVGIDLVAKTAEGDYWAIQCKCYSEDAYITKHTLDSFMGPSGRTFFDDTGQTVSFANRLWISTTNKWTSEATAELKNQTIPCSTISLADLRDAQVDWEKLDQGLFGNQARLAQKRLWPHQTDAIEAAHKHFKIHDRGKLILACGSGKTLTALRIAITETGGKGLVLFLAPSIALIGQTLREWSNETTIPLNSICVCSDPEVSKSKTRNPLDMDLAGVEDLALPATTSSHVIAERLRAAEKIHQKGLTVIFSTYQSIQRVSEALEKTGQQVDIVICDEAHRTTGVKFADEEDTSHFVKVHENSCVKAKKRLYMTATPRVYGDYAKGKAKEASAILCSMDDENIYGPEIYRLGFGEAVDRGLLSDYKVLVLTINRKEISPEQQAELADGKKEIGADDVTKLIGCVHALSKDMDYEGGLLREVDPGLMRRAVAFCRTIPTSKAITDAFNRVNQSLRGDPDNETTLVDVVSDHIDGTMGAATRDAKMAWLKDTPNNPNECRILTNVRCLSEGIDVPSLDSIMFLSPKNAEIEVVQSVGRVMRKAPGKKYGYIIIAVIVPSYLDPEETLEDHASFGPVWAVLNALKSHDDRFVSTITKINFNERIPDGGGGILIGGIASKRLDEETPLSADGSRESRQKITAADLLAEARKNQLALNKAIYGRLVKKVGSRRDMLLWAEDVAKIAEGFKKRITKVVGQNGPHKVEFEKFVGGLQQTLNPSVDSAEAIEMLAQHLITQPVFEAVFENYSFVKSNPISQSLEAMIDVLEDQGLAKDRVILERFYHTVKQQVSGIDNAAGKQKIILSLYDNFFKFATPMAVEKLGIVYTPVEIVDFIVNSVAKVLKTEFGRDISDNNVHILDPFTGTGTFITRLIQSGLLGQSLKRKYSSELHANEITLLAYYIASVNIENVYHDAMGEMDTYSPFEGICLTDTFQLYEKSNTGDLLANTRLKQNNTRVDSQKNSTIQIILGNPPYSTGQRSANDNAQNQSYPTLEADIAATYAARSKATNKNSLYDSYVKSIFWASRRLPENEGGIIAFVSNAGWIDGNAMDGMRKCLAEDFSSIYSFNLRGNARTSGELRRKEKDNVFGQGTRTPVAITILVKNPNRRGPAEIYYSEVGDYLTREDKLAILAENHNIYGKGINWQRVEPNEAGDWLNQRNETFECYIPLGDKDKESNYKTFFKQCFSRGVATSRDIWCYNSSRTNLINNISKTIEFYNYERVKFLKSNNNEVKDFVDYDTTKISWGRAILNYLKNNKLININNEGFLTSLYRPFFKQYLYFDIYLNDMRYQIPKIFPTKNHKNLVICLSGVGVTKEFSLIITNLIPDLEVSGKSQCFPRYYYEKDTKSKATLFKSNNIVGGYARHDAITDYILKESQSKYGPEVTKDDIFFYVYGLLHSEGYRKAFSADLKKMLPRLPLVDKPEDFWAFSKSGRDLADLHLNYETVMPYGKVTVTGDEGGDFTVDKIRFASKDDKSAIQFNHAIRISGIPLEAYDYVVNGRSPIEWVIDRYQVKEDKDSGITNNPNDWAKEHNQPRYILDLILRLITVSLETNKIVKGLPRLGLSKF
jgi:predicted helicase